MITQMIPQEKTYPPSKQALTLASFPFFINREKKHGDVKKCTFRANLEKKTIIDN